MGFIKDVPNWRGYGRLVQYNKIGSTNEEAKILARAGAGDWTIVHAKQQTAGRGRHGNQWVSKTGNLYMSVLLRKDFSPEEAGHLSFITSVAVMRAVGLFLTDNALEHLRVKWPNDVLVYDKKISGILIETETVDTDGTLPWVVVGVGINIDYAPDYAICLHDTDAQEITTEDMMTSLCKELKIAIEKYEEKGFTAIRDTWIDKAYHLGEEIKVRLPAEEFLGIFRDIDDKGALLLEMEDGSMRSITSGEVFAL